MCLTIRWALHRKTDSFIDIVSYNLVFLTVRMIWYVEKQTKYEFLRKKMGYKFIR